MLPLEPRLSSLTGGHRGEETLTAVPAAEAEGGGCPDRVFGVRGEGGAGVPGGLIWMS